MIFVLLMDLVYEVEDSLTHEFCKKLIEKFESDPRKYDGVTVGGFTPEMKSSTDLVFSHIPEWNDISDQLDICLKDGLKKYISFLEDKLHNNFQHFNNALNLSYQLQKSGYYKKHHDSLSSPDKSRVRIITYIWYLSTHENEGETGFLYKNVKPVAGKLVFFPATWTYTHEGLPATDKYIITGWLYADNI
jgi:hypothetical protein